MRSDILLDNRNVEYENLDFHSVTQKESASKSNKTFFVVIFLFMVGGASLGMFLGGFHLSKDKSKDSVPLLGAPKSCGTCWHHPDMESYEICSTCNYKMAEDKEIKCPTGKNNVVVTSVEVGGKKNADALKVIYDNCKVEWNVDTNSCTLNYNEITATTEEQNTEETGEYLQALSQSVLESTLQVPMCEDGQPAVCSGTGDLPVCSDGFSADTTVGKRPCADRVRPQCPEGETLSCADGSTPKHPKHKFCPDGEAPQCSSEKPMVCKDGSEPDFTQEKPVCANGKRPHCARGDHLVCNNGKRPLKPAKGPKLPKCFKTLQSVNPDLVLQSYADAMLESPLIIPACADGSSITCSGGGAIQCPDGSAVNEERGPPCPDSGKGNKHSAFCPEGEMMGCADGSLPRRPVPQICADKSFPQCTSTNQDGTETKHLPTCKNGEEVDPTNQRSCSDFSRPRCEPFEKLVCDNGEAPHLPKKPGKFNRCPPGKFEPYGPGPQLAATLDTSDESTVVLQAYHEAVLSHSLMFNVCKNGAFPVCADGALPQCPNKPGRKIHKKGRPCKKRKEAVCTGGEQPECEDGSVAKKPPKLIKVCTDGSTPKCAKSDVVPTCRDGTEIDFSTMKVCPDNKRAKCPTREKLVCANGKKARKPKLDPAELAYLAGWEEETTPEGENAEGEGAELLQTWSRISLESPGFSPRCRGNKMAKCSDGGEVICSDGFAPPQDGPCEDLKPPTCNDGQPPVCPNGKPWKPRRPRVCKDKSIPKCKSTGEPPKCSDGSPISKEGPLCPDFKRPRCPKRRELVCEDGSKPRKPKSPFWKRPVTPVEPEAESENTPEKVVDFEIVSEDELKVEQLQASQDRWPHHPHKPSWPKSWGSKAKEDEMRVKYICIDGSDITSIEENF